MGTYPIELLGPYVRDLREVLSALTQGWETSEGMDL